MNLREYLLADRQWKRDVRINRAKVMLRKAATPQEKQFWRDVLNANED